MTCIHTHRWPVAASRAVRTHGVYLLHGRGEHGGRYERLANWLTQRGWPVGAHDLVGHGRSGGTPGVLNDARDLSATAAAQVRSFADECGALPVLLGHSLGGVLAAELVLAHDLPVAGLVLSAPALMPSMSTTDHLKLQLLSRLAPNFRVHRPFDATWLTHDPDEVAAASTDSLLHGHVSAGLVRWLVASGKRSIATAGSLSVDTLLLLPQGDRVVDPEGSEVFARRAPSGRITVKRYADSFHEVFNETPDRRELAMADLTDWLDNTFS